MGAAKVKSPRTARCHGAGAAGGQPRDVAGAIVGVLMALWFDWVKNQDMDVVAEFDRAMAHLEDGLPL
ncbi:hypothetical protein ACIBI9_59680 [Nonomuraea sp. NPDC050451]|uniref:acyl-CoA-like ligand-binding transcription factor n=1 Tax=Nonomuraea sp. NPDC050451 TaxID=3364364 RepID=UPI00378F493A